MIEPVELKDFFYTFLSAAGVILFGAGYSALYAWFKLRSKPGLLLWAFVCYAALAGATLVLARVTHLNGEWRMLVALMLAGYLVAPPGIYRLCSASHKDEGASVD